MRETAMTKKLNGNAKWLILAVTIIFSSGILWNKVNNLEADVGEIKQDIKNIHEYLLHGTLVSDSP